MRKSLQSIAVSANRELAEISAHFYAIHSLHPIGILTKYALVCALLHFHYTYKIVFNVHCYTISTKSHVATFLFLKQSAKDFF